MNKKTYSQILDAVADDQIPEGLNLTPQIMSRIQKGKGKIMQPRMKVFTVVVLALLAFVVLFFTVPEVAAAIQHWFGYVPGVGLVRDGQIRVLTEPVSLTREGITVTVEQALVDPDHTVIVYKVEGMQPEMFVTNPETPACHDNAILRVAGSELSVGPDERHQWETGYEHRSNFPVIPADIQEVTFVMPCIQFSLVGIAPENWELPLRFKPAPPDMTSFPVIEISTPTAPAVTDTAQATPASDSASITLSLDRAVQMDDGYLIYASIHWQGESLYSIDVPEPENTVHLLDASGQAMLFEYIYDEHTGMQVEQRQTVLAIKTAPVQSSGPLTIVVDTVSADQPAEATFTFDPGSDPEPGQTWQLNQNVQVGEYSLRVLSALAGESGYSFQMRSDSGVLHAELIDLEHKVISGSGGGGGLSGEFSAGFSYAGGLPAGPVTVTITAISVQRNGPWQAQWTPPSASTKAIPTHPAACLNASSWRQAVSQKPPLPQGLNGKVLLSAPSRADSGEWALSLTSLDGSGQQMLTGARDGSLSAGGSRLAYSSDGIYIIDLTSNQTTKLPGTADGDFNPLWSPDGSQIAFMRGMGIFDLFLINADGSGLRSLTSGGFQEWPIGWTSDGQHLIYSVPGREDEYTIYQVDVQTGERQLFSNEDILSISPDGKHRVTREQVFGGRSMMYISGVDGSNRWLLANSDLWTSAPLWSPDGQWLMVSVSDTDWSSTIATLVRLEDCQIIPLPYLKGQVTSWSPTSWSP